MKTKLSIIVILFLSSVLFAQESKVPKNVKENFTKKFTNVTNVKWDVEGKTFEANFEQNAVKKSATYNSTGKLLETETEIEVSSLPKRINKYIMTNYKGYDLIGAAKILSSNGNLKYEAEIHKGNFNKDLMFDKNGNSLQKIQKKMNEKEDDDND